jgi:hypothetical protein
MDSDTSECSGAERRQCVLVLEPPEFAFNSPTATVEALPFIRPLERRVSRRKPRAGGNEKFRGRSESRAKRPLAKPGQRADASRRVDVDPVAPMGIAARGPAPMGTGEPSFDPRDIPMMMLLLIAAIFCAASAPVFVIGRRRGLRNPWVAFIPLLGIWIVLPTAHERQGRALHPHDARRLGLRRDLRRLGGAAARPVGLARVLQSAPTTWLPQPPGAP